MKEVFQVLNRTLARLTIFEKPEDYEAFMRVLDDTQQIAPLPILAMVAFPSIGILWFGRKRQTSSSGLSCHLFNLK